MTRNARNKKRTRRRAQRDEVPYCVVRHQPAAPDTEPKPEPDPVWLGPDVDLPERPGPDQLLRAHVEGWCSDNVNASPEDLSGDLAILLDLPGEFEDPTVAEFEPDLDSIETRVVERYESGPLALAGTAQATLSIEGVMMRAEAYDAEVEGWVQVTGERNERYVEVLLENGAHVELEFTALVDLTNRRVEDFDADVQYVGSA